MSCHHQKNSLEKSLGREFGCPVSSLYGRYRKGSSENEKENGEQWHGGEIGKGSSSVVFTKPAVPILGPLAFFVRFLGRGMGYNKINGIVYISVSML